MYLFGYGGQAGVNSVKGQVCLNQGQRSDVVEGTTNRSHLVCIQRDAWPWFGNRACNWQLLHQQWLCVGCICGASTSGFQNMKPQSYHWIANHVCTQDSAIVAGVNFRSEMDYNVAGMFSIYDYWWVCLQMFYLCRNNGGSQRCYQIVRVSLFVGWWVKMMTSFPTAPSLLHLHLHQT